MVRARKRAQNPLDNRARTRATHERRHNMLCLVQSLEAVHGEEEHHSWGHKPSSQARFMSKEHASSPDHKEPVKKILVQLGHRSRTSGPDVHLDPKG